MFPYKYLTQYRNHWEEQGAPDSLKQIFEKNILTNCLGVQNKLEKHFRQ